MSLRLSQLELLLNFPDPLCALIAAHHRHDDVHEDQLEKDALLQKRLELLDGDSTVLSHDGSVAHGLQGLLEDH